MTQENDEEPFIVIGNDELGGYLGETIECIHCGGKHEIKNTQDNGDPSILSAYKCGDKLYICGIEGRAL